MTTESVVMVGTRKGLVARAVRRAAGELDLGRSALRHARGLLVHGRHPRWPDAAAGRGRVELDRPAGGPLRRPRRDVGERRRRRDPVPRGHGHVARAGVAAAAWRRRRRRVGGHRAGCGVPVRRPRGDLRLERALWEHPQRSSGARGSADRPSTRCCHTRRTRVADGRDLHRRGLPDRRRRCVLAAAQPGHPRRSCPRASSTPSSASACTRSPGTRRVPSGCSPQNHGGVYRSDDEGGSWESIAEGLPSDFGFPIVVDPHDADTVYVFPLGGAGGRYPPEGNALRVALARRRRDLGAARRVDGGLA